MDEFALVSKLAPVVVVSIGFLALEEHLANEVERMKTAADATMGSVKLHLLRNRGDGGVIIADQILATNTNYSGYRAPSSLNPILTTNTTPHSSSSPSSHLQLSSLLSPQRHPS